MSVTAIRKALENLEADSIRNGGFDGEVPVSCIDPTISAVVRVGLRACDEWAGCCSKLRRLRAMGYHCPACDDVEQRLAVIADILRESGVEVGE